MNSEPFNIILRGGSSDFTLTVNLPVHMGTDARPNRKYKIQLASHYIVRTEDVDDGEGGTTTEITELTHGAEIRINWGLPVNTYDTGFAGVSDVVLINTLQCSTPPYIVRDIPSGPTQVKVTIFTDEGLVINDVALQLCVTPCCDE